MTFNICPAKEIHDVWVRNIGGDQGIDALESYLHQYDNTDSRIRQKGMAGIYTWLMKSVWGPELERFGDHDSVDRIELFAKLLSKCPNAIRFAKSNQTVRLVLRGRALDFRGIVGVSSLLPVNIEWFMDYIAGKQGLYSLREMHIAKTSLHGFYSRSDAGIVANAMINLFIVEDYIGKYKIPSGVFYKHERRGVTVPDLNDFRRSVSQHFRDLVGTLKISSNGNFVCRLLGDKVELGDIPQIVAPQTGRGTLDHLLTDFGFLNYGKTSDNETKYISDLNVIKPSAGSRRLVRFINGPTSGDDTELNEAWDLAETEKKNRENSSR